MFKTAIVILNWNGLEYLKAFLGIVIRYSSGPETSLYVADNGSTDGSAEWIAKNHKEINLIKFDKNHGFAAGYNLALEQIDARYYLLLNSDVEVTEGWLQHLEYFMDNNTTAASCQPKILSYKSREYFEYAGAAGGFIDKYGYAYCRGRIFNFIEKDTGQYDSPANIFWSTGACMIVRADAWKTCGGFDPGFFAHMEEIDLCWRFRKAGFGVNYIPDSVVYHVGGGTLPYNSPFKTYLNFRNSLYMLHKNLPRESFHSVLFVRKVLDGVAALMFLLKGNVRNFYAILRAHIDYYRNLKNLKLKRRAANNTKKGHLSCAILNKSIVFEFYIKGNKTFDKIKSEEKN